MDRAVVSSSERQDTICIIWKRNLVSLFFLLNLSALLFNRSSRHFLDWLYRVCVCVCFVHTNDSLALVEPRISILALRKKPYNGSQVFRFTGLPMSLYPFKPFKPFRLFFIHRVQVSLGKISSFLIKSTWEPPGDCCRCSKKTCSCTF
jgi:hypothetical protein